MALMQLRVKLDGRAVLVEVLLTCSRGVKGVLAGAVPRTGCSAALDFVADADQGYRNCGG